MRSNLLSVAARPAALSSSRRTCYWVLGLSGRVQPYARGDVIPKIHVERGLTGTSSDAARLTGSQQNIAYDSDNIFDPKAFTPAEGQHYRASCRQLSRWVVPPLPTNESAGVTLKVYERMVQTGKSNLWFESLWKDYPTFKKAFIEFPGLQAQIEEFFRAIITVASDEAAVTAIAKPFMLEKLEKNFIAMHVWWRIAEALMATMDLAKNSRFENVAAQHVIERVMKIALNTIADQPWAHEELTDTKTVQLIGDRVFHEGGYW
jgi:hypothetical protein